MTPPVRRLPRRIARWLAATTVCITLAAIAVVANPTVAHAADGVWAGSSYIPDGAAVREENSFAIFQVVNGGAFWIRNVDEFYGLGYTLEQVYVVPAGALAGIKGHPNDGTLIRDRHQYATFLVEDGTAHWIDSVDTLNALGYTHADIRAISNGATATLPRGDDITRSSLEGQAYSTSEPEAVISASGWKYVETDTTHLESGDAKARLVGGVKWYRGKAPRGYLHRGNVYEGTKAYAAEPVGCIWARINWGFPAGSVSFPPGASVSGAAEVGKYFRSCRQGRESRPSPINLNGLGYAKAELNSATFTVCTSARAADGPRYCSNEKELWAGN